jgi:hypothetical protein
MPGLLLDDFEVFGGEAVEVGNPVIDLGFPVGDALPFGVEALLDEGGDRGFISAGGRGNQDRVIAIPHAVRA